MFKTEYANLGVEYGSMCKDMNDMTEESNEIIRNFFNNVKLLDYVQPELNLAMLAYNNEIYVTLIKFQWFKFVGLIENINMVGSYSEIQAYIIIYLQKYEAFLIYFEPYLIKDDINLLRVSRDTMHVIFKDHDNLYKSQLVVSKDIDGFLNSTKTPIQNAVNELIKKENPFGH
jgi:hypothetical protein